MSWSSGNAEVGYIVMRWSPSLGTELLPAGGGRLSAAATSFADTPGTASDVYCYAVLPMGPSTPLAVSDLLCAMAGAGRTPTSPNGFTIRLDETSTARLSWSGPGGQSGYQIVVVPLDNSLPRILPLSAGATSALVDMGGTATCFFVQAMVGVNVVGATDVLCGVPGVTTFK
jgi:hypothetical protein